MIEDSNPCLKESQSGYGLDSVVANLIWAWCILANPIIHVVSWPVLGHVTLLNHDLTNWRNQITVVITFVQCSRVWSLYSLTNQSPSFQLASPIIAFLKGTQMFCPSPCVWKLIFFYTFTKRWKWQPITIIQHIFQTTYLFWRWWFNTFWIILNPVLWFSVISFAWSNNLTF